MPKPPPGVMTAQPVAPQSEDQPQQWQGTAPGLRTIPKPGGGFDVTSQREIDQAAELQNRFQNTANPNVSIPPNIQNLLAGQGGYVEPQQSHYQAPGGGPMSPPPAGGMAPQQPMAYAEPQGMIAPLPPPRQQPMLSGYQRPQRPRRQPTITPPRRSNRLSSWERYY